MDAQSLEALGQALIRGDPVRDDELYPLSGLEGEALQWFSGIWSRLGTERRVSLVQQLDRVARDNLAMDFVSICALAIDDPEPGVRHWALRLAGQDATPSLLDPCLKRAQTDPDPQLRLVALEALETYTLAAQADDWPARLQERLEEVLLGQLRLPEGNLATRQAALLSLAYLTTSRVEEEIGRAHLDPALRATAIEAMGRNCQEAWAPQIAAALDAEDPLVRLAAAGACAALESAALVPNLVARLQDEDEEEEVHVAIIVALGTIGGEEALAVLGRLAESRDAATREAAHEALAESLLLEDPWRTPEPLQGG